MGESSTMVEEAALFQDSDEDEGGSGEAGSGKKKSPEERKYIFRKELRAMLYGFGDDRNPREDTLDALEQIVIQYMRQVCEKCLEVGKPNRLTLEDIHYLIRRDQKKFARVKELLQMHDELKKARKAFDDVKEI